MHWTVQFEYSRCAQIQKLHIYTQNMSNMSLFLNKTAPHFKFYLMDRRMKKGTNSQNPPKAQDSCRPKLKYRNDPKIGPTALPRASNDLNTPVTMPFWWCSPYWDTRVVRQGTTKAVEIAQRPRPRYSCGIVLQEPTMAKLGTINSKPLKFEQNC